MLIETPKDTQINAATWSDYKSHNTFKFLISINPDGYISYVSNAGVGAVLMLLVQRSQGSSDSLEPYDVVMPDKGISSLQVVFSSHMAHL